MNAIAASAPLGKLYAIGRDIAAAHAHGEPVERSWAIRFALSYLYDRHGGDRRRYDEYWQAMDCDYRSNGSAYMSGVQRSNTMSAALEAIYRFAGLRRTPTDMSVGARGRRPKSS